MKTYEELMKEWGESACGRSPELYIYDEYRKQAAELLKTQIFLSNIAEKAWYAGYTTDSPKAPNLLFDEFMETVKQKVNS